MYENNEESQDGALVELGRSLGGSRTGQFLVSCTIAVLFGFLAYVAWNKPDWSAIVLACVLVGRGLDLAWRCFPISRAARARWKRTAEEHRLCRFFCGLAVPGIMMGIIRYSEAKTFPEDVYLVWFSAIFIGISILGHVFLMQRVRASRSASDQALRPS